MMISDLVVNREADGGSVNLEKWCSCIDGALTKKNYLDKYRKNRIPKCRDLGKNHILTIKQMIKEERFLP